MLEARAEPLGPGLVAGEVTGSGSPVRVMWLVTRDPLLTRHPLSSPLAHKHKVGMAWYVSFCSVVL
jgi:hypothetical protein